MSTTQASGQFQAEVAMTLFAYGRPSDLLRGVVSSDLLYGSRRGEFSGSSIDDLHLWVITKRADPSKSLEPGDPERVLPTGPVLDLETVREAAKGLLVRELGINFPVRLRPLDYLDNPTRAASERVIAFPFWGVVEINKIASILGGKDQVGLESVNSRESINYFRSNQPSERFDGTSRFGFRVLPDTSRGHIKYLPKDFPEAEKNLALDHDLITFYAWRRLRYAFDAKVDPMRAMGVNPLGSNFRLSELQELFEVSLGEELQRDAFRRAMLEQRNPFIEESGETDSSRQGKPAKVYRLKDWAEPERSRN